MAGGKETPRQKMIGVMYLFLTAMLALNVSKDVLNAFLVVNTGLEVTNKNFQAKNDMLFGRFASAMAEDPVKTKPWFDRANQAKKLTEQMIADIDHLKDTMMSVIEKVPMDKIDTLDASEVANKDNYDEPTRLFIGVNQTDGKGGMAEKLKNKIIKYKADMLNLIPEAKDRKYVKMGLNVEELKYNEYLGTKANWEMNTFWHTNQIACICVFNQLIAEVLNAEADIVAKLLENISASDFKFDMIEARVIPKSNYILEGDKYEADIFVAAYSTTQSPEVIIREGLDSVRNPRDFAKGGGTKIQGEKGVIKYIKPSGPSGLKKYAGVINIKTPGGEIVPYAFKSEYVVAKPTAVVSATAMNVFYIGLDNPLSVSVPGIPDEKVDVRVSGGNMINKGGKKYVTVSKPGKVLVEVFAKFGKSSKSMGKFEYRVKKVPNPVPMIAGKSGGAISKGSIIGAPYVAAILQDFLFDGVRYRVKSFTFLTTKGSMVQETKCSGSDLNSQAISYIKGASSGQRILFEDIVAVGPDGTDRPLPSMIFKLL